MAYADPDQRRKLIDGLRALATFFESHPDVPAPRWAEVSIFARGSDEAIRSEIDHISSLIGAGANAENSPHGHYTSRRTFGPVTYSAIGILSAARADYNALMSYEGAVIADASKEM
ncbi:hypothetical protein [Actinomadura opuntiae]|uniref:hypothetical protein n=1 Tax=Actinomadura sp. OS1-43 TaxID=604315 RepID=UPI00255AB23F|nr:hypothetical protein [Actinomadura sp. OS1-43]MDL4817755.1 hypothetical protein [Actinomadura sp. OS1-43]